MSHDKSDRRAWKKFPFKEESVSFGTFDAAAARHFPASIPIPIHYATVEEIKIVERLGLDPKNPNFEKLRGKLLQAGLRPDDLPTLSVEAILAMFGDEMGRGTESVPRTPTPDRPADSASPSPATQTTSHTLRDKARSLREKKEVVMREQQIEAERLEKVRKARASLSDVVIPMMCAFDPFGGPAPTEAELKTHYARIVPQLCAVLRALHDAGLWQKLARVDQAATLAQYRQRNEDPEEMQIVFRFACEMLNADPDDSGRLLQLVRESVEEPVLRRSLNWVQILLSGLVGDQLLCWKKVDEEVNTELVASKADHPKNPGLAFNPGELVYGQARVPLKGKPWQVLKALSEARNKTKTAEDLRAEVWADVVISDDSVRSAVSDARMALRQALQIAGAEIKDPIPCVDRGSGRLAWRLSLP